MRMVVENFMRWGNVNNELVQNQKNTRIENILYQSTEMSYTIMHQIIIHNLVHSYVNIITTEFYQKNCNIILAFFTFCSQQRKKNQEKFMGVSFSINY